MIIGYDFGFKWKPTIINEMFFNEGLVIIDKEMKVFL